jgi:hypothetical protein
MWRLATVSEPLNPMTHAFLSWWEALLTRLLMRSHRIGTIAIREYGTNVHWVLYNNADPFLSEQQGALQFKPEDELEPPSMLFERMYHAPDANR